MARAFQLLSGEQIAQQVADSLRPLYGSRLKRVILYGSWARGEADPEGSDVDLLVILDSVDDYRAERDRIGEIADDLAVTAGRPVMTFPVSEGDLRNPQTPVLVEAVRDGIDFYPVDDQRSA